MASQKRLLIGSGFGTSETSINFLSNHNFHEANLIIWHPESILNELGSANNPILSTKVAALRRRLSDLSDWIFQGNTLILINHTAVSFRYREAGSTFVGTLEKYAPLNCVEHVSAEGKRVEYCGPSSVSDLLASHIPLLQYKVVIEGEGLVPLLKVELGRKGASQIVGGYQQLGEGYIFYLPPLDGSPSQWGSYVDDASKLRDVIEFKPSEYPEWIDLYQSVDERSNFSSISELEKKSAQIDLQLKVHTQAIEEGRKLKRLLFETGPVFAVAVSSALLELGFTVVDGPEPRADLLASDGKKLIAIEAKGVEGGAKERDVRQSIQWVAELNSALVLEEGELDSDLKRYAGLVAGLPRALDQSESKGFLIMGTFRKLPLSDRVQPSFPEPVSRVLERNDICALTGAQLYALIIAVRQDNNLKATILNELMNTKGVYQRGLSWNDVLVNFENSYSS